jgi:hypothetical protein
VPNVEQIAKVRECCYRNEGSTDGIVSALGPTHPTRERVDAAIRRFTEYAFTVSMLFSAAKTEGDLKERMPSVLHRDRFEIVGTMKPSPSAPISAT